MSKTTADPTKYYRTGIAIPLHRKPVFDERLAKLGLKTVGDLTSMFILADGVIEALLPVAEEYRKSQGFVAGVRGGKTEAITKLRKLPASELARLLALSKKD